VESHLHTDPRIFPTRGVVSCMPRVHSFIHSSRGLRRSSSRSSSVVVFVVFVEEEDRDGTRRPTRAFVGGDGSLSSCMSLARSSCLSLAMSRSLSLARAPSTARPRPPLRPRTRPRTRACIHARTHERIHSSMHPFMHPSSSVPTLRRRRGWISRDARRETSSRDVVARLETREREERERRGVDLRIARPRTTTGDDDATSIRFDSISSFDFDLI